MTRCKKKEKSVDDNNEDIAGDFAIPKEGNTMANDNGEIEFAIKNQFPFIKAEKSEDENSVYILDQDPRYYTQRNEKNGNLKKKKIQIWFIRKTKRKGRMIDSEKKKYNNASTLREHNKHSDDNIIRKLKIYFTKSLLDFVNKLYQEEYEELNKINKNSSYAEETKEKKWLLALEHKIVKRISKQENLEWFNMTIKEYLSSNITHKFNNYPSDYNEQKINLLYTEKKFKKLKQFLEEEKIKDIFDIYANDRTYSIKIGEERFLQFSTLKNDLNEIIMKGKNKKENNDDNEEEDEGKNENILDNTNENTNKNLNEEEINYINKIKYMAIKLYDKFDKKSSRKTKK